MKHYKGFLLTGLMAFTLMGSGRASVLAQENPQFPPEKNWAQILQEDSDIPALKPMSGIWIDWRKRKICAFGRGFSPKDAAGPQARLLALRAAKADALRRLAALIYGIHLKPSVTVDFWGQEHPEERKRIEGVIKGAQEAFEPELQPDGSYEIQLVLPLAEVEGLIGMRIPYQ